MFVLLELIGRSQAQPADVDPPQTLLPAMRSAPGPGVGRRSRSTPRDQHSVQERAAAPKAEGLELAEELSDVRAAGLPAGLQVAAVGHQGRGRQPTRSVPLERTIT